MKKLLLTLIATLTFSLVFSQGNIIKYEPVIVEGDTLYKRVEESIVETETEEELLATPNLSEMIDQYKYWQSRKATVQATLQAIELASLKQLQAIRQVSDTFNMTYPEYNRYADSTWTASDTSIFVAGRSGRYDAVTVVNKNNNVVVMRLTDKDGTLVNNYPVRFIYKDEIISVGSQTKPLPGQTGPLQMYYNKPRSNQQQKLQARGVRDYTNFTESGRYFWRWKTKQ